MYIMVTQSKKNYKSLSFLFFFRHKCHLDMLRRRVFTVSWLTCLAATSQ